MNASSMVVSIPPDGQFARIVRMVASSAAAEVLTVDGLDDLALAIDEACAQLLQADATASLEWTISASEFRVEVSARAVDGNASDWPPMGWEDSLEAVVLNGVAEGVEVTVFDEAPGVRFHIDA